MSNTTPNHHAYLLSLYTPPFRFDRRGGFIWVKQDAEVTQQKEQADIDSARRNVFYPMDARIIHDDY